MRSAKEITKIATLYLEGEGGNPAYCPSLHTQVFHSSQGAAYLKGPGLAMIARTETSTEQMVEFVNDLGFDGEDYTGDVPLLTPGAELTKAAGQLCYLSFGEQRTRNADAGRYIENIMQQGHGSVLEHCNLSFLFYGVSRSLTHELVRHRAGFGFSQTSQRYVDRPRFVERPEYQGDTVLHAHFLDRIDLVLQEYQGIADRLMFLQGGGDALLSGERRTELRKKVNQAARSVLPNETEAPIIVTANARAWRHFVNMRASQYAEVEIRRVAYLTLLMLQIAEPLLFGDFEIVTLPDGTKAATTPYPKV